MAKIPQDGTPPQDQSKVTPITGVKPPTAAQLNTLANTLPGHLRPTDPGLSDEALAIDRMSNKVPHMFWHVTDGELIAIADSDGHWRRLHLKTDRQHILDRVTSLSAWARAWCFTEACNELPSYPTFPDYWLATAKKQTGSRHYQLVMQQVLSWIRGREKGGVSIYAFNKLRDNPETCVWPLADGSVYSLARRVYVEPSDMLRLMVTAPKVRIPDLGWDKSGDGPDLLRKLMADDGPWRGIPDYVAQVLARPERRCLGAYVAPSGFGKTTLAEVCVGAFPGLVFTKNADSLLRRGSQFAPINDRLTSYRLVIMDEAQDAHMNGDFLRTTTANALPVEFKGVDSFDAPRTGGLLMLGTDWPGSMRVNKNPMIDPGATAGLADRFSYLVQLNDIEALAQQYPYLVRNKDPLEVGLSNAQHRSLLTPDVFSTFRYMVRQKVENLLPQHSTEPSYAELTPQHLRTEYRKHWADWCADAAVAYEDLSEPAKALFDKLGHEPWKRSNAELQQIIEDGCGQKVKTYKKIVIEAYKTATSWGESNQRGWQYRG